MPLNTNIAISGQPVQIANPMELYGKMASIQNAQNQNALAQFQLGSAQRTERSQNLLADAYAQSTDPATGKIDYNKLTGLVAGGGGGAQIPAIQKSRLEQESAGTKLLADKLAVLPNAYKLADTPEAYLALHQSVHADPVLGPWLKSVGATPEKGLATLQKAVETNSFDDLRMKSMQSVSQLLESVKPLSVAAGSSVYDPRTKSFNQAPAAPERTDTDLIRNFNAAKAQGFTGTIFDYERKIKEASRQPTQPVAPTVTQIVDPTNPNQMISVDARRYQGGGVGSPGVIGVGAGGMKPLTEGQTIKLRTDVAKDYKAATTALSQMDDLLDSIESVKTAPGLSSATGFTGKYLPSFSEGKAAQAETRLANLRGKVTALGKATAAMSGAIGSIANQEWKILSDQIAALDEVKGKGPLLEQIDLVEQQARGAIARVRDTYEKTRSEDFERFPQFRDLPAPRGKKDSGGGNIDALLDKYK
jgi:hypothetical protein